MTSKEIEKMKNEEVLEILLGNVDYKDYSSETMRLVNSCVSRLWEILERLEVLEKENKPYLELLTNNAKYQCENTMLLQENEKLKKENEQLEQRIAELERMIKNA